MAGTLGILLAGGRGRRLGLGPPKALASWAGGTLLDHALATLRAACDEVVVSAPRELAPWYNGTGVVLYVLGMMAAAVALGAGAGA